MEVLFLDDCPNRIKNFRSTVPWATIVSTAEETIAKLQERVWDYVFLDHDLGGEAFVDSDREDCGMEVVRWVLTHRPDVKLFVVHSCNEPAAMNMESKLKIFFDTHRVSFHHLLDSYIIKRLHDERQQGTH